MPESITPEVGEYGFWTGGRAIRPALREPNHCTLRGEAPREHVAANWAGEKGGSPIQSILVSRNSSACGLLPKEPV